MPFDEITVAHNGYLDPEFIKKFNIDIKNLPYLIHKNLVISGVFPIIKYCCIQFGRSDLLGRTLEDSILVAEIMAKEIRKKGMILHILFKGLKEVYEKNLGKEGIECVRQRVIDIAGGKEVIPLKKMFSKHGGFMCGYLTVIDFHYYEKAFYATNMNSDFATVPDLEIAKAYKMFFESTDFFKKHGKRLSEYKIFFPEVNEKINAMIK